MNRYFLTQIISILAVFSAVLWWYFFPSYHLYAADNVERLMCLLQSIIVPNAFLSLLTAVLLLPAGRLRRLGGCFIRSVLLLWGIVCSTLLFIWFCLSNTGIQVSFLPTFTSDKAWIVVLVPIAMVLAIILGTLIVLTPKLRWAIPWIQMVQEKVARLFEVVFLVVPLLVFFVTLRFLHYSGFDMTEFVIHYFVLAVSLVLTMNLVAFPLLYRFFLGIPFRQYIPLVTPVVVMTFLAGDSVASVPMIVHAADQYGEDNHEVTRILALVMICFPWVGELSNLVFPVYTALLESYDFSSVVSILSVGPFFMFTDPYISIPTLLSAFNFSEGYQVAYMTVALLTDHMFEICESIAVLFVVMRLKLMLFHNATLPGDLKVERQNQ